MSHARTARAILALVALAVVLAVGALLGALAAGATLDAAAVQPPAPVEAPAVEAPTVDYSYGESFLTALAPDAGFTPAEVEHLVTAADRVCEGFLAGVPYMDVVDGVVTSVGIGEEDARHFTATAAATHCAP